MGAIAVVLGAVSLASADGVVQAQGTPPVHGPIVIQPPTPAPINQRPRQIRSGVRGANIDLINGAARHGVPERWDPIPPVIIYPPVTHPPVVCPPRPCPPPPCHGHGHWPRRVDVIETGSGISIGGGYRDDRWNIGFRVGEGRSYYTRYRGDYCYSYPLWHWGSFYGSPWYGWGWSDGRAFGYGDGTGRLDSRLTSDGRMPVVTRGPQLPPEPEIELTNMQKAERALRSDSAVSAISYLKLHLKDAPDDVRAQRWLAVALLAENRADDAQAVLRSAYRADPGLADDVMLPREMGYTRERWRALVNRASSAANVSKSASGWLLLGVLMQAEERGAMAKQMVERAAAAGLEPQLVAAFGA
jgi:hypothetical protein